ncbi:hypothetical protein BHU72_11115 [Desulfuribacillus stibiiarsenatis]|uniref:RQC P-site tRNA stabilizing factor n=1 Tax=Desulfuribacillus stibiiarsenatis TaxID=1390249 RepID=A0A1E5L2N0_9FIRM|nr:RNA-binding S4 domain-containing protein [Desulfuribacillus stibiiarsenatis]OEH84347.1 hypothetical protein BHU72_11115 [Desulfuribacillus stibiiarsenatis]
MRLDKFLKVSRLIKRRTLAKEVCDQGRIEINERAAKASTEVKANDLITIRFARKVIVAKVCSIRESASKSDAEQMYEIIKEESIAAPEDAFWSNEPLL